MKESESDEKSFSVRSDREGEGKCMCVCVSADKGVPPATSYPPG